MNAPIRVLLADDHQVVRAGIRVLLEQSSDIVVGEAGDGAAALRLVEELAPDVLLLDAEMSGQTGVEVARRLQAAGSPVRVLVLSAHDEGRYVAGLLASGVAGYLLKEEAPQVVIEAVRGVARSRQGYFSPAVAAKIAGWARGEAPESVELTEGEVAVLRLVAAGETNRAIAKAPGLTVRNLMYDGTYNRYVYSTKSRDEQALNEWVCKYGITTGYGCGQIVDKSFDPGVGFVGTFIRVHNPDNIDLAEPGDSGGPWFWNNTAYGITTHQVTVNGQPNPDAVYMAVNYFSFLHLTVLTE